jgi:hypothetical protein
VANRKLGVRRKVKRWTALEEETLRKAVEEYLNLSIICVFVN